jgi:hypothetical protein
VASMSEGLACLSREIAAALQGMKATAAGP